LRGGNQIRSKAVSSILLIGMLSSTIVFSFSPKVDAQFEQWVPCVPDSSKVELDFRKENGTSCIDISIEFPSGGFNISDWGTPTTVGSNISANAEIWRWTGVAFPVVITEHHTYTLGNLPTGEYLFTFKVWGFSVKNTTFIVQIEVGVGGYEFPTQVNTTTKPLAPLTSFLALIVISVIGYGAIKLKARRKARQNLARIHVQEVGKVVLRLYSFPGEQETAYARTHIKEYGVSSAQT